jgi:DNA-binding CsgD family transcriptional regulator
MVAVTSGEVSGMGVGNLYCGVIEACSDVFDWRRAREWTDALRRWCEDQPELVPYRGPCLVHHAEVLQFSGAWSDALQAARRACEWLSAPASPEGPGDAFYRLAELQRLRGEFEQAEQSYRQASLHGRRPEPGLPLLWLAKGAAESAQAALERSLLEEEEVSTRARLLDATVQIALARRDVERARAAGNELEAIAASLRTPAAQAMAATAAGATLLAEGRPAEAVVPLRRAWLEWHRLEAPYDAARVRRLLGIAYRELMDHQSAAMEFDAARRTFEQLGAIPELRGLDGLVENAAAIAHGDLTPREIEVLRLLATGLTNRQIGGELFISEHTVARHVQNSLAKLGLASRAALAAFAVEHHLLDQVDTQK